MLAPHLNIVIMQINKKEIEWIAFCWYLCIWI